MFGFGPATRIYVATGATDMRKHFNGLYGLVRDHLCCNPESRHVFPFTNARRNRLKLLVYDRSGLWVCTKKAGPWLFQVAWCRQRGEENRAELSGVEPVFRMHRPCKDGAAEMVSQGAGGRISRVTEDRIKTGYSAYLSTKKPATKESS